jgi:hypothetical protein
MKRNSATVTKGPNGPPVNFKKQPTYYSQIAEQLKQFAEKEWDSELGELLYFQLENLKEILGGLKIHPNDVIPKMVSLGFLKMKTNDPPGWYLILKPVHKKNYKATRRLQQIADRLSRNARIICRAGSRERTEYEHLDVIRSIIKDMGHNPDKAIPWLVEKKYLVPMNSLPMEPVSYHVFRTQKEGRDFCKAKGRI